MRSIIALTVLGCLSSAASAQIVYGPVVTQYGGQNPYYYAGDNPLVHASAAYPSLPGASWGRHDGFAYTSARRIVVERHPRVVTEFLGPHGNPITDLTPADVQNAANARLPRYFSKAELLEQMADEQQDAAADEDRQSSGRGSIVIIVHHPATQPTTRPAR